MDFIIKESLFTTNNKEIKYYKEKENLLLKKAIPLMNIYRKEQMEEYKLFLLNDSKINGDRKKIFSSLPLFTINNELLIKILKKKNIPDNDIKNILSFKKEEKNIRLIINNNEINDIIYKLNIEDFQKDIYISLENMFYVKKSNIIMKNI